jgi:hypothetical protein
MKKITFLFSLLMLSACERDDLCTPDQATTPRMVVVFKDFSNPAAVKTVPALEVREIGSSELAPLNFEGATRITEADTVRIPLRNSFDLTSYNFFNTTNNVVLNSVGNFSYSRTDEFVSRACGFRTIYSNLDANLEASSPWINEIRIVNPEISNSFEVHVEVLH